MKIIHWGMMMSSYEKCGYYSDGECNICGMGISGEDTFCRLCKDNPNCYYKQLDKLRAEKDKYYQQTLDDEIKLNESYQVLQEIREIAERQMRCCTCKLDDYKSGCKECEGKYAREIAVEILQILTKAEEEWK